MVKKSQPQIWSLLAPLLSLIVQDESTSLVEVITPIKNIQDNKGKRDQIKGRFANGQKMKMKDWKRQGKVREKREVGSSSIYCSIRL